VITHRAAGWRSLVAEVRHMHPLDRRKLAASVTVAAIGGLALVGLLTLAALAL
jgi:hypothetical protein